MTTTELLCGIDLGGTKIELIVLEAGGTERLRHRVATPAGDYDATLEVICGLVRTAESAAGTFKGVGIGTPGAISKATGRLKNSNSVCLNGQRLPADLEQRLGKPVRIANDADCFALSEATDGTAATAGTVFGVILGTGVGAGIVVRGRLLEGPNAIAGEWGHNPLPWPDDDERPGAACYCGRNGCIETFLSGPAMAAWHHHRFGIELTAERIAAGADAGDATCLETMVRYENRLARSLAHVINIVDPHVIVLGGGLSNCLRLYHRIPELWGEYVFSDRVDTRLVPPRYGDSSGVRGAAWLWAD
ncbi:MAG: ROK family protein [Methylococcaceae bacterium]|nr:ROK family protein [Methylococcaceae bacterium]